MSDFGQSIDRALDAHNVAVRASTSPALSVDDLGKRQALRAHLASGGSVAALPLAMLDLAREIVLEATAPATCVAEPGASHRRKTSISSWSALLSYARSRYAGRSTEAFAVLFLDKKNQFIAEEILGEGTVDHAPVYPREVVARALQLGASAIILMHNHPSGDPTPSTADVDMTRQVIEACRPLRIGVHDHLVIASDAVASLKSLGLM
jgi:DNA repair protein RadC